MSESLEIIYRDFCDVPRIFFVEWNGQQILFDCSFEDDLDDYPEHYAVYLMPPLSPGELDGDWLNLSKLTIEILGSVAVKDVVFDQTKRKTIDIELLRQL